MAIWTVKDNQLSNLFSKGDFAERFISLQKGKFLGYVKADGQPLEAIDLRPSRSPMPIKPFCFPAQELVARYGQQGVAEALTVAPKRLIVGARACELRALVYMDKVFGNPPVEDPFYKEYRNNLTIVSVDCVEPHETCFCNLVEGAPYAKEGFDVNLTPIDGAYVVEAGTDTGREFIAKAGDCLTEASQQELAERDNVRKAVLEGMAKSNTQYAPKRKPSDALADAQDTPVWDKLALGCVECGACTQICPTCHCFYLKDFFNDPSNFERIRAWDSCMWSGYSRMAGAAEMKPNPRSRFRTRFANRFLHKYLWSPQQWEMLGCVGCGRCIEACPGKIDLREVIREVSA